MKRHPDHEPAGGPASLATREDLSAAVRWLEDAEALRAKAVAALVRVAARGDGEAAVGMPVDQHLRWSTNLRRGAVSTLSVITDVAGELPTVMAAHVAGRLNLDQVAAIAWPAAKVSRALRRELDGALAADDGWERFAPDALEFEVARLIEDLTPALTLREERERAQRQYLHLQPSLDGQGLKWWGQAWGVDAALIDATLRAAAPSPVPAETDPDGVLVGRPSVRAGQLFEGLLTLCRAFKGTAAVDPGRDVPRLAAATDGDNGSAGNVTIYAIVDERDGQPGSGEVLTATRGLAPRLTPTEVARLRDAGARTITVFAANREIVAVQGRAGHALDDPSSLSEDTTRIICTIRDRTCRAPGCDRPAEHLHHLVWRGLANARGQTAPDDPKHRVWLCTRCHHRVVHRWRWAGTVGALGHTTWHRPDAPGTPTTSTPSTTSTVGRLAQRLPRPPPPPAQTALDPFGDPVPF